MQCIINYLELFCIFVLLLLFFVLKQNINFLCFKDPFGRRRLRGVIRKYIFFVFLFPQIENVCLVQ